MVLGIKKVWTREDKPMHKQLGDTIIIPIAQSSSLKVSSSLSTAPFSLKLFIFLNKVVADDNYYEFFGEAGFSEYLSDITELISS